MINKDVKETLKTGSTYVLKEQTWLGKYLKSLIKSILVAWLIYLKKINVMIVCVQSTQDTVQSKIYDFKYID